jgi:hypothetical protein
MATVRKVSIFIAALLFSLGAPLATNAADGDSGMVTQVQGNVTYVSGADKAKPLLAFMKLRAGDKLALPATAKVQLVYFQGGRQETWRGAAQVEIGASESRAAGDAQPPEVKKLPELVLQQLTRAPKMVTDLKNRSGMIFVRSLPTREKLRELDDAYAALRKDAAADDVTPELFLLSGLHELKLYQDMKAVLEEMRQRQPDNAEVQMVYEQYSKVMEAASGRGK